MLEPVQKDEQIEANRKQLERVLAELNADTLAGTDPHDFAPELVAQSLRQPNETAEKYLARLLQLYPSETQRNYLEALFLVCKVTHCALHTLQNLSEGTEIPQQALHFFAKEENEGLVGIDLSSPEKLMVMRREVTADVVSTLNSLVFLLTRFEQTALALIKEKLRQEITDSRQATTKLSLGIGKAILGENAVNEAIGQRLDIIVTAENFLPVVGISKNAAQTIARYIGTPFNPIELWKDCTVLSFVADELGIYPEIYGSIEKAVADEILSKQN